MCPSLSPAQLDGFYSRSVFQQIIHHRSPGEFERPQKTGPEKQNGDFLESGSVFFIKFKGFMEITGLN
jgi:hypothetical protein